LAVQDYLAKGRSGTAVAKSRGFVRGGGAKPWRQKGTGRARAGTNNSPLWNGGGVIFPPSQRRYAKKTSYAEKKAALKSALSARLEDIVIIEDYNPDKVSTKEAADYFEKLGFNKALIIADELNENNIKSTRNLRNIKLCNTRSVNVFDLLKYETIAVCKSAVEKLQEHCLRNKKRLKKVVDNG
jgi:large subunit ribosomal protein L4